MLAYEVNAAVQQRYLDSARASATLIATVGIQPLLSSNEMTQGLSPSQVSDVDAKLQGASVSDQVRRIKVWNRSGTVMYSDNPALIGKTFPIDDDLANALQGHASASITTGQGAENEGDNLSGPLVQVYVPLVFKGDSAASGAFELYLPYAPVQAAIDAESRQVYALLAIGLGLFYASMFPVVALANRWRRRAEAAALANTAALERLNKLKSEFLVRISHQFRTALVGIEGFSEVIRDSDQLDATEVRAYAEDIYNDAQKLDRAFAEMIELDRMETGQRKLELTPIDLDEAVGGVVDSARRSNPRRTVVSELGAGGIQVLADRAMVSQLLTILIDNAIRYSGAGADVRVTSAKQGDAVEVVVHDSGPGMRTPDGADGIGIGLSLARQIVTLHRGRLSFDSSPGRGTDASVTLPIHAVAPRVVAAAV